MKYNLQRNTEDKLSIIKSTFEKDNELSYQVFHQLPIGICITDSNGFFTDVNSKYCDIYGYSKDELIGHSFTTIVPDEYKTMLIEMHDKFISNEYELQGKWTVQDKQNKQFDIITNAAFLHDEVNDVKKKMTLVVKVSELEVTIENLKTTIDVLENKIVTQNVAQELADHDMRNRIASMVSVASILSQTKLDDKQAKWVNMLKDIGNDTIRLLTSANDFSKMERGEYNPQITSFDLISLIANETRELKNLILEKKANFNLFFEGNEYEPGSDEVIIDGDKFYLQHLFQNLLRNALEASPKNAIIDISIDTKDLFTIRVNNIGVIPEKIRGNFFDKYTTSGKERGTGLGTYMAKMIAEVHSGSLSFLTNEKDGTTLILKLPKNIIKV